MKKVMAYLTGAVELLKNTFCSWETIGGAILIWGASAMLCALNPLLATAAAAIGGHLFLINRAK